MEINKTSCYEMFKFHPRNRPVTQKRLNELIVSIKAKNMLSDYPINVTADGTILDGQTRFSAAKHLGIPIYYIISEAMTIDDVKTINSVRDDWSPADYMHYYCTNGNENYLCVKRLCEKYPDHPLSTIRHLLSYGDRKGLKAVWENGQFVAVRKNFTCVVLDGAAQFKAVAEFWKHSSFVGALATCFDTQYYDNQRMVKKAIRVGNKFKAQPDVRNFLVMLTEVYNYGESEIKHLQFRDRSTLSSQKNRYIYPE